MTARIAAAAALVVALVAACACLNGGEEGADAPRAVAERLLALHGLLGRQAEQLSQAEKDAPVDREAVAGLVDDVGAYDEFISDLYVGFVVGALARNQGRWTTAMDGEQALIAAGDARILFVRNGGAWKVSLAASVPDAIKERAAEEKRRFEAAKAAGHGLR